MATSPTCRTLGPLAALILVALSLGGCGSFATFGGTAHLSDRECMARVMYFESNRSSDDGMLAVGTVVMNRLQSPKYPKTVCGVIGQRNQFAEGALSNPVSRRSQAWARAERAADAVLSGDRHAGVGTAMFFHTAGYTFPYTNMHYVTLAGGNAFYEKRRMDPSAPSGFQPAETMLAAAKPAFQPRPVQMASAEPEEEPAPVRRPRPAAAALPVMAAAARPAARLAAAEPPPARPKPIVLAMLEPKRATHPPRSIEDLIEMDLQQR